MGYDEYKKIVTELGHKDSANTYTQAADSQEAISEAVSTATTNIATIDTKLDVIQPGGTDNLNTIAASQATILDLARAGDSGTTTLDGSEQTLYEETDTTAFIFNGGIIDLTAQAAGDTVIIRQYAKIKAGGAYVGLTLDATWTFAGVPDPLGIVIAGDTSNVYGYKVTIEHTVVAAAFDVDAEFFDSKAGG